MEVEAPCYLCLKSNLPCDGKRPCMRCQANNMKHMCLGLEVVTPAPTNVDSRLSSTFQANQCTAPIPIGGDKMKSKKRKIAPQSPLPSPSANAAKLGNDSALYSPSAERDGTHALFNMEGNPIYAYLMAEIQRLSGDYMRVSQELKATKELNNQLLVHLGSFQQFVNNNVSPMLVFNQPVVIFDMTFSVPKVFSANAKYCELFGYSLEEVVGAPWRTFIHPNFIQKATEIFQHHAYEKLSTLQMKQAYVTKLGSTFIATDFHLFFYGPNNQVLADFVIITPQSLPIVDQTQVREMLQALHTVDVPTPLLTGAYSDVKETKSGVMEVIDEKSPSVIEIETSQPPSPSKPPGNTNAGAVNQNGSLSGPGMLSSANKESPSNPNNKLVSRYQFPFASVTSATPSPQSTPIAGDMPRVIEIPPPTPLAPKPVTTSNSNPFATPTGPSYRASPNPSASAQTSPSAGTPAPSPMCNPFQMRPKEPPPPTTPVPNNFFDSAFGLPNTFANATGSNNPSGTYNSIFNPSNAFVPQASTNNANSNTNPTNGFLSHNNSQPRPIKKGQPISPTKPKETKLKKEPKAKATSKNTTASHVNTQPPQSAVHSSFASPFAHASPLHEISNQNIPANHFSKPNANLPNNAFDANRFNGLTNHSSQPPYSQELRTSQDMLYLNEDGSLFGECNDPFNQTVNFTQNPAFEGFLPADDPLPAFSQMRLSMESSFPNDSNIDLFEGSDGFNFNWNK